MHNSTSPHVGLYTLAPPCRNHVRDDTSNYVRYCRSQERKRMNENGLTTWLADQLVRKSEFTGDRNKYEMYDLEYSLALFMNLSRCRSAVQACKSRARDLFKSLTVFITSLDVDVSMHFIVPLSLSASGESWSGTRG